MNSPTPKGNLVTLLFELLFSKILAPISAALFIVAILYWIPRIVIGVF